CSSHPFSPFFFFHPPAPTHFSPLSLHDALPISFQHPEFDNVQLDLKQALPHFYDDSSLQQNNISWTQHEYINYHIRLSSNCRRRSEEHTSELQSQSNLVCRLLLEKKKKKISKTK